MLAVAEYPKHALTRLLLVLALAQLAQPARALTKGSMINFITVENKVRFDVALPQAERGQLKISARLLAVARKVITS